MNIFKIDRSLADLVDRLFKKGYVIANGHETGPIVRALKNTRVHIPVNNGYVQGSKQVILALEKPVIAKIRMKTLKNVFFELEDDL